MPMVPTLLHDEMLEMWTVSFPIFMPATGVPVLVPILIPDMLEALVALMSMLELMLIPDMDIVALGSIDIPDIVLLIIIDPPSM